MMNPLCKLVALSLVCLALKVDAKPVERRAGCSKYTIIVTRGTGEIQGGSSAFNQPNQSITRAHPGGSTYNTVYPADASQNSQQGTNDIVRKVKELVDGDSSHCVFLEGYSQGAAATVNALPKITDNYFDAVKQVVLVGDPLHKAGLACNVDDKGGKTTLNANGISAFGSQGIPDSWVSKSLDICTYGDGVCDSAHGFGITFQHFSYISSASVHDMTVKAIEKSL